MKRPLSLALTLLLTAGMVHPPVHAETGLGRLFNSPQERQALDRQRSRPAASPASGPGAPAGVPYNGPGIPGLPAGAVPVPAPDPASGMPPNLPPNLPPGMVAYMPGMPPSMQPAMPVSGGAVMPDPAHGGQAAPADPAAAAAAAAPSQLTMNGVLRTSNGRSTVWLNNVPQGGSANKFSNRNRQALTVTLPSGKRVVLQPGQRYDLADGRVKDISEP